VRVADQDLSCQHNGTCSHACATPTVILARMPSRTGNGKMAHAASPWHVRMLWVRPSPGKHERPAVPAPTTNQEFVNECVCVKLEEPDHAPLKLHQLPNIPFQQTSERSGICCRVWRHLHPQHFTKINSWINLYCMYRCGCVHIYATTLPLLSCM
jgi:hypothetical protein